MNANKQTGRARIVQRSWGTRFENPHWEERFDTLIRLTRRTETILELTGTDMRAARVKDLMDKRYAEWGEVPLRPRGVGRRFDSVSFLQTRQERFDASYLIALHFGSRGPGEYSETEEDLGRALDKRFEVYLRYRSDLYPSGAEPKLDFDSYHVLLKAIAHHAVEVHSCPACGSRHARHAAQVNDATCPVCLTLELRMANARREFESRLQARRDINGDGQLRQLALG